MDLAVKVVSDFAGSDILSLLPPGKLFWSACSSRVPPQARVLGFRKLWNKGLCQVAKTCEYAEIERASKELAGYLRERLEFAKHLDGAEHYSLSVHTSFTNDTCEFVIFADLWTYDHKAELCDGKDHAGEGPQHWRTG